MTTTLILLVLPLIFSEMIFILALFADGLVDRYSVRNSYNAVMSILAILIFLTTAINFLRNMP